MATLSWDGATSGQPPLANQINQFLGTHAVTLAYTGTSQNAQTTLGSGSTSTNSLYIAQSFTTASAYTSTRVVLDFAVTGSPTPLTVSLQSNNAGAPSGTVLATIQVPSSFTSAGSLNVSMPLSAPLANATTYWIVMNAVGDPSNLYSWLKSNQVSGASTSANGTTWAAQTYGLVYQVYSGTSGSLLHTYEDSGARWTIFTYNGAGTPSQVQEYTVAQGANQYVNSSRSYSYTNGLLTSVA